MGLNIPDNGNMSHMTEIRNFKDTIGFSESNRVVKYSPKIYDVTLNFHTSYPSYESMATFIIIYIHCESFLWK